MRCRGMLLDVGCCGIARLPMWDPVASHDISGGISWMRWDAAVSHGITHGIRHGISRDVESHGNSRAKILREPSMGSHEIPWGAMGLGLGLG